jgi:hypothetical protein
MAHSCEHVNKHSGSIKGGEILDYLRVLLTSPAATSLHGFS